MIEIEKNQKNDDEFIHTKNCTSEDLRFVKGF